MIAHRLTSYLTRHWLLIFGALWGLYVGLPWLAPVFMELGWTSAANTIYMIYATQCHQLPQRSLFLFGPKLMYSLSQIQSAWQMTDNPLLLRQFIGNTEMGWKVAWSDRMISLYTSLLVGALIYWPLRKRFKPLPVWVFILLMLPLAIDGGSHFISDLAGIGYGFRDNNAWLAALTFNAFPSSFYAGDGLGSFNSWMRWVTGPLMGLGLAWFILPYCEAAFAELESSPVTQPA
jgi:uncharacterized membrane protein